MKSCLRTLALAFIGVPIFAHIVVFILALLIHLVASFAFKMQLELGMNVSVDDTLLWFVFAPGSVVMLIVGWLWARYTRPTLNIPSRHCLLLLPALLALTAWVAIMQYTGYSFVSKAYANLFYWSFPWWGIDLLALLSGWYWGMVLIPVGTQICFTLGYSWRSRRQPVSENERRYRLGMLMGLVLLSLFALWQAKQRADKYVHMDKRHSVSEVIDIWGKYRPDVSGNNLTRLQAKAPFQFSEHWPRWDGATAAYPLYASAFYALNTFPDTISSYDIRNGYLKNSRTPIAYQKLIDNKTDIIFVAQPSEGQKKRAQEAGVTLTYTPFAREAFVFIVNANNPVESLTGQQVRDIFSGKITRWSEVGGCDEAIQVWQRPVDSGSQTVMLEKVMKQTPMLPAKETEVARGMGRVIREVADYQNTNRSIGYTFRYYATQMNSDKGIKLLAINGIYPSEPNIRNGSYPYSTDVYMVTRGNPTPETQKIVDWFISPQGQLLVQDVGYVPLYPMTE
ncbi:PstS family phosphate ABC transporter substrate-binding protein [Salmonella enterica subsp. enterica serovar Hillegersberg]|uniref:PstS family phosphate ABC transporter substrate-binding protein n=1 Tax=Salmonella enterica TaxID=28901 RepID=UPI001D096018|nr:PstS family phosphate ABC transporter substrate-binding protein [Salmonella enterica]MCB7133894.1 PstS family phosphate ABC transporter substrate-binding protein [Salmonella enterica subsp. enterica serovar Hillegersberg]